MSDNKLEHEALKASALRRWRVQFEEPYYDIQYVWAPTIRHARAWARNLDREHDPVGIGDGWAIVEIVEVSRNEFTDDDHVLLEEGMEESSLETEVTIITRKTFELLLKRLYAAGGFVDRNHFMMACFPDQGPDEALSSSPGLADWFDGWAPEVSS